MAGLCLETSMKTEVPLMFRSNKSSISLLIALSVSLSFFALQSPASAAPAKTPGKAIKPPVQHDASMGENLMYYTPPPLVFDANGKPIPNMPNLVYQANAYFEAGQKAFYKNDLEFAESYLKKSIECRDKLNKVREAKEYVTGVNLLGKVLKKRNKWEEAEKYYRQALTMASQGLGVDAYEVKECELNLAECYEKTNKYQDAIYYYRKLLTIAERKYGPDDPDVQDYCKKILALNIKGGNYEAAQEILKQRIDFEESQGRGSTPATVKLLEQYAEILKKACKMEEAAAVEEKLKTLQGAPAQASAPAQ
ncbi:MAG TPA: tetratricopeptide repeat protein [Candidatus Melainabacteria bacterium]|jgi:tetratricopeptide (TPR) repeat protein|nr:tetratricopeptide repeat protein [Candidatus Melainabacteria bacterium]HIN64898.1 tetratricopeptide repeat protein [Candidatus Obscuribacterales bacterium]